MISGSGSPSHSRDRVSGGRAERSFRTMERRALVMCRADPNGCPRPLRMIRTLLDDFRVTSLGTAALQDDRVRSRVLPPLPLHRMGRPARAGALILRRYARLLWSPELARLAAELRTDGFDVVFCHDPDLLPLALAGRGSAKVVFDAREYYPRHFENRRSWRLLYRPMMRHLCGTYLPQCDAIMTVSPSFARMYQRRFGVEPVVIESVPPPHDLEPSPVTDGSVRIVHHGWANRARRIELMIRTMEHLDSRFSLDLILMPLEANYMSLLQAEADRVPGVRILPPVPYDEIIPTTNRYDVGLFLCPPTTFNLLHTIPNKLFEFIQARLAVAIGPLPDQSEVLDRYGCGLVAEDFEPRTMAELLNRTDESAFRVLKERAHRAAGELNSDAHRHKIAALIEGLLWA